ncbi:MAG: 3-methyl-2-oxobutanoate hydroxymethyltransferase [Candidatus Margulisiibacteriota bacterium]
MEKNEKVTVAKVRQAKKIVMLTAYDYPFARILDEAGSDIVLVGDSLGNVVLGHKNTRPVTMADMVHHTKAAARGVKRALLVADMPYRSVSVRNAKRLIGAGARAVKIEGLKGVKSVIEAGIPVMGHLGYLPQTMGKPKVQRSVKLLKQARALAAAGVFAITLEMVEPQLARAITAAVSVPTIGIGSGPFCDGQVLVSYDLLGLSDWTPRFVRPKANLKKAALKAIRNFIGEVRA